MFGSGLLFEEGRSARKIRMALLRMANEGLSVLKKQKDTTSFWFTRVVSGLSQWVVLESGGDLTIMRGWNRKQLHLIHRIAQKVQRTRLAGDSMGKENKPNGQNENAGQNRRRGRMEKQSAQHKRGDGKNDLVLTNK